MATKNISSGVNYATQIAIVAICIFLIAKCCYAQPSHGANMVAPEPGSMALIVTGIAGGIVRFARMRFKEFKRIFDIIVSAVGLVVAIPAVLFTALIIKVVSPGPAFFTQKRVGCNGKIFTIYKLRSMRIDAEKHTGATWAKENDSRLIRFGKYIRKARLDELPQLLNVLKGEMSIIGPRPERPELIEGLKEVIPDYEKRLQIKPGITGLAQVWHKYDETIQDVKKKIRYDLLYIKKMCFLVDLRILARTMIVVATGRGAK